MSAIEIPELVVAFVPEQVNVPFTLASELGFFRDEGIKVIPRVVPEGTGKMLSLLESGEVDLAVTVTDGFIAGRASGRNVQLHGTYVKSPLVWAIAAAGASQQVDLESLKATLGGNKLRIGISRIGSGSYTMGIYAASLIGLQTSDVEFVVANNLLGLKEGVNAGDFDVFLWESFTTKPSFDRGEVKRIGAVATPWPSFSFVGRGAERSKDQELEENKPGAGGSLTGADADVGAVAVPKWHANAEDIKTRFFPALQRAVALFMGQPNKSSARIVKDFGHKAEDADLWLSRVQYNCVDGQVQDDKQASKDKEAEKDYINSNSNFGLSQSHYSTSVDILKSVGLVPEDFSVCTLWADSTIATLLDEKDDDNKDVIGEDENKNKGVNKNNAKSAIGTEIES